MASNPGAFVLDSFALLAYLEAEPGMPRVRTVLANATAGTTRVYLSLMNLGEVVYIVERERGLPEAQRLLAVIEQLPITVMPVTRATVLAAAHIKARYPVAYADAFAVVTAQDQQGILVTGDPEFKPVVAAGVVQVEWLPVR